MAEQYNKATISQTATLQLKHNELGISTIGTKFWFQQTYGI
jgi:hypothetical protein